MPKIEDLDVDRVDGVDTPATGHKFLLLKSAKDMDELNGDDLDELRHNAQTIGTAAQEALTALVEYDVAIPHETVATSLNRLAKMLRCKPVFAVAKTETKTEPKTDMKTETTTDEKGTAAPMLVDVLKTLQATLAEQPQKIAAAVLKSFEEDLKQHAETSSETEPAAGAIKKSEGPAKSKQPQEQDRVEKAAPKDVGKGLFTSVIFS